MSILVLFSEGWTSSLNFSLKLWHFSIIVLSRVLKMEYFQEKAIDPALLDQDEYVSFLLKVSCNENPRLALVDLNKETEAEFLLGIRKCFVTTSIDLIARIPSLVEKLCCYA